MSKMNIKSLGLILLVFACLRVAAQSGSPPAVSENTIGSADAKIEAMSKLLLDTQQHLEETQQQLNQLRSELDQLKHQKMRDAEQSSASSSVSEEPSLSLAAGVEKLKEEQEVLDAQVKQHDQTKLESLSKYPIHVYGLLLLNSYSNAGVVDNPDLPSVAIPRTPGESHGSIGGSFRQTLLGISANGPQVLGARSSADLNVDFFGSSSYSYYGSENGNLRLRRGNIRLAWGENGNSNSGKSEISLGIDGPLISPLSPTSFATVANPALAWSGNLWTWAPELQFKHTSTLSLNGWAEALQLEGGLWDPPTVGSAGSSPSRMLSAGELSRRPGYLARVSIHGGSDDRTFAIGFGGFSDRQTFSGGQQIQLWAVTSDWQIPIARRLNLEGEIYRGRGLGGLGGGVYKDTLSGTSLETGLARTLGLNAVGGWAQLKAHLSQNKEANVTYGQD